MKPKNFPERRQLRQFEAAKRKERGASRRPGVASYIVGSKEEAATLAALELGAP